MPATAENRGGNRCRPAALIGRDPEAMPGKRQTLRRAPAASGRIASAVSFAPFDPPAVDNQASLSYADLWVKNRARPGHHIFIKGAEKAVGT
jgi:hypothetical protein